MPKPGRSRRVKVAEATSPRTKRTDGRWEALLSDGYNGQGRRQRRSFLGRTRGEVQRKLDEARQRLSAGEPVADDRRCVAEFLEQWLSYAEQRVPARTFERYRSIVRQHLIPQLGNLQPAKLSPAHVEQMLAAQLESGLSARTVHHHRGLLRNALIVAQRWDLLPRNVAALAAPPKVTRERSRRSDLSRLGKFSTLYLAIGSRPSTR